MAGVSARVVVTRPAPEAARWVAQLQALHCPAMALPLMEVVPVPWDAPRQVLSARLPDFSAVMWVSAQAVSAFMAHWRGPWPAGTRCWAPGPGTARALQRAGVPESLIDAPAADAEQFDSEALWAVVAPQARAGARLLLLRGRSGADAPLGQGRDWLLQRCREAGVEVEIAVVYERRCAAWSAAEHLQARQALAEGCPWLFSSAEALSHLDTLLPGTDWRAVPAIATHPRIAAALRERGFGRVSCAKPLPQDIAQLLAKPENRA